MSAHEKALDKAWERVNALGGFARDDGDESYCAAVSDALLIIEDLGGMDPLVRPRATLDTDEAVEPCIIVDEDGKAMVPEDKHDEFRAIFPEVDPPFGKRAAGFYSAQAIAAKDAQIAALQAKVAEAEREEQRHRMTYDFMKTDMDNGLSRADKAEAAKAELLEGLKPFVSYVEELPDYWGDKKIAFYFSKNGFDAPAQITAGDFRRARALIEKHGGDK